MASLTRHIASLLIAASAIAPSVKAEGYNINYSAEAVLNAGNGDFAPYYVASNRHGIITQSKNALLRASISRPMQLENGLPTVLLPTLSAVTEAMSITCVIPAVN